MISGFLPNYKYQLRANTSPGNDDCFDFICYLLKKKGIEVQYCYSESMEDNSIPAHDYWLIDIGSKKVERFAEGIVENEALAKVVNDVTEEQEWAQFAANKDTKDIFVNGSAIGEEKFMYLIASLTATVFSDIAEYTEEEVSLLTHLMKNETGDLSIYLFKNAKDLILSRNLKQIEDHPGFGKEAIVRSLDEQVKCLTQEIERLFKDIRIKENSKKRTIERAFSMRYLDDDDHELENYLKGRSDIIIDAIDNNEIRFYVVGYLDAYDADYAKTLLKSDNWINSMSGTAKTDTDSVKTLMQKVFVERKYKLKGYSHFTLSPDEVSVQREDSLGLEEFSYQNPHHFWHQCLGENASQIEESLHRGDFIAAVECCCGAAHQMNLMETTVTFDKLVRDIFAPKNACNKKCFFCRKDGKDYTLNELLEREKE